MFFSNSLNVEEKTQLSAMPLELRSYSDLSRHIKEHQNTICLNFVKRHNLKAETLFLVRSNKALCDYFMGGALQIMFVVGNPLARQPGLEL